jgi:acetyltransferase-like isoleucine patch superfamily enzyme
MEENIFFDTRRLKYCGANVIIGKTVRIRYPELVELHDNVIIDDFTYISCGLVMYKHAFIENNCSLMGGQNYKVVMGNHSGIASNCTLVCSNLDFKSGLQLNHNRDLLTFSNSGDIVLNDHAILGYHCTVYPGVTLGEGARTSEYTRVSKNLDPWGLYYGISAKKIDNVDKDTVLAQLDIYKRKNK